MKPLFIVLFALFFAAMPFFQALAQEARPLPALPSLEAGKMPAGEVTSQPVCGELINRSSVSIWGVISTYPQTLADGTQAAHTDNFRLASMEKKKVCASGPFYEGRRVLLTIRTLFPLFECKTRLDGRIFLDMYENDRNGQKKYTASCR